MKAEANRCPLTPEGVLPVEPWAKGGLKTDYGTEDDEGYPIPGLIAAQLLPGNAAEP